MLDIWRAFIYVRHNLGSRTPVIEGIVISLTLWPWSWTFTVYHTIFVKCEYFMNQEG